TRLDSFKRPNIRGIRAIALNPGDELVEARISEGDEEVILASAGGYANRFPLTDVRPMGRTAAGVRGMRLRKEDRVISMALVRSEEAELLTVLESGYGKRTKVKEYRKTRRGSQGVVTTNMKIAKSPVVAVLEVEADDELFVTTAGGVVIRCPVHDIRETGRAGRGDRELRLPHASDHGRVPGGFAERVHFHRPQDAAVFHQLHVHGPRRVAPSEFLDVVGREDHLVSHDRDR